MIRTALCTYSSQLKICLGAAGDKGAVQTAIISFIQSLEPLLQLDVTDGIITIDTLELDRWLDIVSLPI